MSSRSWIRKLFARPAARPLVRPRRLGVEALEDRAVPATFIVTSLLDDGSAGTLRWAVDQANATAGADAVTFAPGVAGGTITLTAGQLTLADAATTTIDGGPAGVTLDAGGAGRVLFVGAGAGAALARLTLTGGRAERGAGLYLQGGTLTLTDCAVAGNTALLREFEQATGVGIYQQGGTLTLTNCTVAGNTADGTAYRGSRVYGVGVYQEDGTLTLTDSTVAGNTATLRLGGGAFGGGLYQQGGALALTGCTVADNTLAGGTSRSGGGVYQQGGTLAVTGSTFRGNAATGFQSGGGGLFTFATATVAASTFTGNSAYNGGGIYNAGALDVSGSTFAGNMASNGGGGIDNWSRLTVAGTAFTVNSAGQQGGGLRNGAYASAAVTDCTFLDNRANIGGGINNSPEGQLAVSGSLLQGNTALFGGGGIISEFGSTATLTNCTLAGNSPGTNGSASARGGAVWAIGAVRLVGCTASGNTAPDGGIYIQDGSGGTVVLTNTILTDSVVGPLDPSSSHSLLLAASPGGLAAGVNGILLVASAADAGLDPAGPADNGGPTRTIALLPGGRAIGAGLPGATSTDQRGLTRNASPDIGAFETQAPAVQIDVSRPSITYTGAPVAGVTGATVTGLSGVALAAFGSPTLSYTYYAGTYTGPELAGRTPLPGAPTDAGSYTVVATYTSDTTGYRNAVSRPSYFTITPKTIAVTADADTGTAAQDAFQRTYGDADPALTYTASGLLGTDGFTGALARTGDANAGVYSVTLGTLSAGANYAIQFSGTAFTITPRLATWTTDAAAKTYGDADPTFTGRGTNFLAADGMSATYTRQAGENAGQYGIFAILSSTTLTASQLAANYTITNPGATLTVGKRAATVTVDAKTKVYGDADPTFTGTLGNFLAADNVTASYSRTAGETVAGGPYTITAALNPSAALANYDVTYTSANLAITRRALTVSATGVNRVYDGTTAANASLSFGNVVSGDAPTAMFTAAFRDKNAGANKPIDVTGIALHAASAANYTLNGVTATTATATITPKAIGGAFTAADRVYDGTTAATVTSRSLNGVIGLDAVTLTGGTAAFADKNAGVSKPVALTGAALSGVNAGNYTLTGVAATTATIAKRALTVSATGVNKVFDGTTAATVTLSDDRLNGDALNLTYGSAAFADASPGINKPVTVSGISLTGADAGNYMFNTTAATTATITPASVSVGLTTDRPVAVPGLAVTFTATVTAAGGFPVTGTVTFRDGATVLGTVPVVNGVARLTTDALQYGNKTITATFSGSFNGPATPPSVGVSVVPAAILFDPVTGQNALFVGGTAGNDEIQVKGKGNNRYEVEIESGCWEFEQEFTGAVGRMVVYAGAGNDVVDIDGNVRVPVYQLGGDGNDELRGAENAPNVLVGGTGNDTLKAGSARDILIGGAGADRLFGKGGDDLMIAGSTAFDVNESALWGIQLEWTSDRSFATRVANLRGTGTGPRANGTAFLVASGPNRTVFDDGSADYLKGGSGRDWYFANVSGGGVLDSIAGLSGDDVIDDL